VASAIDFKSALITFLFRCMDHYLRVYIHCTV